MILIFIRHCALKLIKSNFTDAAPVLTFLQFSIVSENLLGKKTIGREYKIVCKSAHGSSKLDSVEFSRFCNFFLKCFFRIFIFSVICLTFFKISKKYGCPKPLTENIKFFVKVLTGAQNLIRLNFQDFQYFLDLGFFDFLYNILIFFIYF